MLVGIVIIFLVAMFFIYTDEFNDFVDKVMLTVLGLFCGAVLFTVSFALNYWYATNHRGPVYEKKYDIVALSVGSETQGSFYLGFGYVNSEPMYYYYYTTEHGVRMDYTNADLTEVIQDATPETSTITYYCEDFGPSAVITWPFDRAVSTDCFNYVNQIHIPPGSIDMSFDASLPNN